MAAKLLELVELFGSSWHAAPMAVFVAVGFFGLASGIVGRLRSKMGIIMPMALSAACLAMGLVVLSRLGLDTGGGGRMLAVPPPAGFLAGTTGAIRFGAALLIGLAGSALMFRFEARVTVGWYRLHAKLLPRQDESLSFLGMAMPGRAESMQHVARISSDKALFAGISLISSFAEEFFYRGALLLPLAAGPGSGPPWSYLALQALWYAANHVAFGVPTIIGKTAFGLVLGVASLTGGLIPALAGHVLYQYLVYRQFTPGAQRRQGLAAPERVTP